MLGSGLLRTGMVDEAREHITHAIRHFHAAGDAAGLTLGFDDISAVEVAAGDFERAARLHGAARNLTTETGTGLATYVEETFNQGFRPGVLSAMSPEVVERLKAEGAAMTLDEAVAYALAGSAPPDAHDDVAPTGSEAGTVRLD
jgi:hypothetical protein